MEFFCCWRLQLAFASMHVTSHAALDFIPPTVYSTFRIGMAVPLLFASARIQASVLNMLAYSMLDQLGFHTFIHIWQTTRIACRWLRCCKVDSDRHALMMQMHRRRNSGCCAATCHGLSVSASSAWPPRSAWFTLATR